MIKTRPDKNWYRLKTKSVRRYAAEVFYFRFDKLGWAIVLIDENTGTVCIHSDYGDWNFSWPSPGRGDRTLKEFFQTADNDYLAQKFFMGRPTDEFDLEGTKEAFKKRIIQDYREGSIKKEQVREFYDEVEDREEGETLFIERLSADLHEHFDGGPWNLIERRDRSDFLWLKHGLLPAIKEGISEKVGNNG